MNPQKIISHCTVSIVMKKTLNDKVRASYNKNVYFWVLSRSYILYTHHSRCSDVFKCPEQSEHLSEHLRDDRMCLNIVILPIRKRRFRGYMTSWWPQWKPASPACFPPSEVATPGTTDGQLILDSYSDIFFCLKCCLCCLTHLLQARLKAN